MTAMARKSTFYSQGLCFTCTRCSACCRYESGYVFLSKKDVSLLGAALDREYGNFIEAFCRWIPAENDTERLSLREKPNFDCIFWAAEGGCSVYKARPLQCRAFPFWASVLNSKESWEAAAADCPGMGQGGLHSFESIEKWLAQRQNEPIISRGSKRGVF